MANQLDEDLLPACPFPGASARYVWENLRELQLAYQDRHAGWRNIPAQFERLARALPTVVALEAIAAQPRASERRPARPEREDATIPLPRAERSVATGSTAAALRPLPPTNPSDCRRTSLDRVRALR